MGVISDLVSSPELKFRWQIVNYFITGYRVSYSIPPPTYFPGVTAKEELITKYGIFWTFRCCSKQEALNEAKRQFAAESLHVWEYPGLFRRLWYCTLHFWRYGFLNR